ncbi:hypothetical protein [Sphingomonas sp. Leaf62]|uniref:hypothetical protein n=1 Tax=Sphingomonas sp. Leaf62 TaxID=1736228 RepID=UPI001F1F71D1|nr:hypothetical protein [Sphingomonas sp. Leaf62]
MLSGIAPSRASQIAATFETVNYAVRSVRTDSAAEGLLSRPMRIAVTACATPDIGKASIRFSIIP